MTNIISRRPRHITKIRTRLLRPHHNSTRNLSQSRRRPTTSPLNRNLTPHRQNHRRRTRRRHRPMTRRRQLSHNHLRQRITRLIQNSTNHQRHNHSSRNQPQRTVNVNRRILLSLNSRIQGTPLRRRTNSLRKRHRSHNPRRMPRRRNRQRPRRHLSRRLLSTSQLLNQIHKNKFNSRH